MGTSRKKEAHTRIQILCIYIYIYVYAAKVRRMERERGPAAWESSDHKREPKRKERQWALA
jgi:hypothetical protein